MRLILKFLIKNFAAWILATRLTEFYFTPNNWSFLLARFAAFVIIYEVMRFAFERKVADLHFQGKKVGEMKEDE